MKVLFFTSLLSIIIVIALSSSMIEEVNLILDKKQLLHGIFWQDFDLIKSTLNSTPVIQSNLYNLMGIDYILSISIMVFLITCIYIANTLHLDMINLIEGSLNISNSNQDNINKTSNSISQIEKLLIRKAKQSELIKYIYALPIMGFIADFFENKEFDLLISGIRVDPANWLQLITISKFIFFISALILALIIIIQFMYQLHTDAYKVDVIK